MSKMMPITQNGSLKTSKSLRGICLTPYENEFSDMEKILAKTSSFLKNISEFCGVMLKKPCKSKTVKKGRLGDDPWLN